jgi:hypothetical protein
MARLFTARKAPHTFIWRTTLVGAGLLISALVGGATYACLKTQRELVKQRTLDEKEAKSRWENEGGASRAAPV